VKDAHQAAREVGRALLNTLGEDLVAVYLHGSAVLGGFRWERSDLDIIALTRTALSDQAFSALARALGSLAYPANGLEFTLMTAREASEPVFPAPRFQLHQTTSGRDRAGKVVDGRGREGDPDLILHLAVCRENGDAIVGPPPRASLAAIPDRAILSAMRDEIRWAREHASLEYLVLTSARAWLFSETHRIVSKIEAGEWAAERYAEPRVIVASLARQRGATATLPRARAERFVEHVERLITRR
jgi:streptomycin 3"-adenylyltransferase